MARYLEFACTSNFSFLRGASHPEELMEQAAAIGLDGIGLCDRNSVAGVVRAHAIKREQGMMLRFHPGARLVFRDGTPDILAYPRDRAGWGRLCRLLTTGNLRAEKGDCILFADDLLAHIEGLELVVMEESTADESAASAKAGEARRRAGDGRAAHGTGGRAAPDAAETISRLRSAAPGRVRLAAVMPYRGTDRARLAARARLARTTGLPLIAVNDVLHHHPDRRPLADVLTCIRQHCTIEEAGRRLAVNAERHLKPAAEMARLFGDAPEAIAETLALSDALGFSLDELRYEYPDETRVGFATPHEALVHFTFAGAAARYPEGIPERIRQTLEHELALVARLRYAPYFLTVHDIVRYARSRNILCQGRGSAANSAICFCLGITEVDPDRHSLLFERFISADRNEPPDIDVDFEHERREEVIQYIYERYGRERAGIAATVISYRTRSAIREVGKAFGLSEDTLGALSTSIWGGGGSGTVRTGDLARAGLDAGNPRVARILDLIAEIQSFPRHLSQHVGGFIITRSRLDEVVPIMNGAMDERTHVEWDKDDLDTLGILKVDVLGLGMLTCLRKGLDLLRRHYPASPLLRGKPPEGAHRADEQTPERETAVRSSSEAPQRDGGSNAEPAQDGCGNLTLACIPAEDPAVYRMLQRADSVGVFQVESRAQMTMLPRLKPKAFYDLVVEVAIVRPGPIQGNMVHPYLRRRQGIEPVDYPSEELREVLEKTLGIPLFQEQAMRIAIVAAGFTPEEADKLRRAMATFKRVGTIGTFKRKMIEGMVAKNYDRAFAERCFNQIEGFGEYGFPESHAASFALLVYASAWLKCRYPDVFAAALLNAQPMGFYASAQIVRDAIEHGVDVRAPDINHSDYDSTLEAGPRAAEHLHALHREMAADIHATHAIRLGLREIKGLSEQDAQLIMDKRGAATREAAGDTRNGPLHYDSVRDLWLRTGLASRTLERLAEADAFGSLGLSRREALWAVKALGRVGDRDDDLPLFRARPLVSGAAAGGRPSIEPEVRLPPMPVGEEVVHDYRTLHLSLRAHPASFLRGDVERRGIVRNETLRDRKTGAQVSVSGLITCRQRPGSANGVIFLTIEDETAIANIIVWPKTFERFRPIVLGSRYIAVSGRMQEECGVIHVVAERLDDLTPLLARLTEEGAAISGAVRSEDTSRAAETPRETSARRGGRTLPAEMHTLAADLDATARGSAHAPARRGGTRAP